MFAIRLQQYTAMEDIFREDFTQRMELHLREHFSLVFEKHTQVQLRDFIIRNWQLACTYRLTSELAVCSYLEAASSLGEDFPNTKPWAKPILEQKYPESDKLERLTQHVLAEVYPIGSI